MPGRLKVTIPHASPEVQLVHSRPVGRTAARSRRAVIARLAGMVVTTPWRADYGGADGKFQMDFRGHSRDGDGMRLRGDCCLRCKQRPKCSPRRAQPGVWTVRYLPFCRTERIGWRWASVERNHRQTLGDSCHIRLLGRIGCRPRKRASMGRGDSGRLDRKATISRARHQDDLADPKARQAIIGYLRRFNEAGHAQ